MFGTRALYSKAGKVHDQLVNLESQNKEPPKYGEWLRHAYQQGKQITQIIAYIWRYGDEDLEEYINQKIIANKLKEYFAHPTPDTKSPMENLKKLFAADARKPESCQEAKLLADVFNPISEEMIFPIFNEFELGEKYPELGYLFEIDLNSFQGYLADCTINDPQLIKWMIPYPPRPQISDVTVTNRELEEWINNRDPNQYMSPNPYIPSSTC